MSPKRKRQQTHVYWESNCAICGSSFTHDRMSAVYCSKTCRNRSRSFSQRFLDSMIRRSLQTLKSYKRIAEAERTAVTAIADKITDLRQVGRELGLQDDEIKELNQQIEEIKAKRKLQDMAKKLNVPYKPTDTDSHLNLTDPEMLGINFDSVVENNLKYINTTDPMSGGSDGFGVHSLDVNTDKQETLIQETNNDKPKGIRKLGRGKK